MASSSNSRIVERDPTGRFVRYYEVLGRGAWKIVYKGFDGVNGIEVAWSRVVITNRISKSKEDLESLCREACLLRLLDHENIVKLYDSWIDYEAKIIHIITELFYSMTLGDYINNHLLVDYTAIKNWCRQILRGLNYLHTHDPPIIHRDVKLANVFVSENSGTVKLGDLGLAKLIETGTAVHGRVGTLQYMAPDLFRGNYNHLVDIHSFGICVLQMVTREEDVYSECRHVNQVLHKIRAGEKPVSLSNLTDPQVKQFIDRCLAPVHMRPAASELLNDPFLAPSVSEAGPSTVRTDSILTKSVGSLSSITRDQVDRLLGLVKETDCGDKKFKLKGIMKDNVRTPKSLSIIYNAEEGKEDEEIEFEFSLETDTVERFVMENIATQLKLSTEDVAEATKTIDQLIKEVAHEPSNPNSISEDYLNVWNLFDENPSSSDEYFDARETLDENERMPSCFGKLTSVFRRL